MIFRQLLLFSQFFYSAILFALKKLLLNVATHASTELVSSGLLQQQNSLVFLLHRRAEEDTRFIGRHPVGLFWQLHHSVPFTPFEADPDPDLEPLVSDNSLSAFGKQCTRDSGKSFPLGGGPAV